MLSQLQLVLPSVLCFHLVLLGGCHARSVDKRSSRLSIYEDLLLLKLDSLMNERGYERKVRADFESGRSGASGTLTQPASTLQKNGHVMIEGRPCKIVSMSTSVNGVHIVGLDIFTQKKYEYIFPSTQNVDVPNVARKDYQPIDIGGESLILKDDDGEQREDIKLPSPDSASDELRKEIKERFANGEDFLVTVLSAVGEEQIIGTKVLAY